MNLKIAIQYSIYPNQKCLRNYLKKKILKLKYTDFVENVL